MPEAEDFSGDGSTMHDEIANAFPQGTLVKYRRGLVFFHDSPPLVVLPRRHTSDRLAHNRCDSRGSAKIIRSVRKTEAACVSALVMCPCGPMYPGRRSSRRGT